MDHVGLAARRIALSARRGACPGSGRAGRETPPPRAGCLPDGDGDGHTDVAWGGDDCDDTDAAVHPGAAPRCEVGGDDDCDGTPDCADPDCADDAACAEDCGNGVDDDGDGLVDCDDGDCADDASCQEDCGNGVDDDGDGLVDCEDGDCADDAACAEDCGNGVDDDDDGLVDCDDEECTWAAGCEADTAVRVRVAGGGGSWHASSSMAAGGPTYMGCSIEFWFDSGTVSSTARGVTCAFHGGRMWMGLTLWETCSRGHFVAPRSSWNEVPHLSPSCALVGSPFAAPPQEMHGPWLRYQEVGYRGFMNLDRTETPAWSVRATVEVTATSVVDYGTVHTFRYFTFVSPFTWVIGGP